MGFEVSLLEAPYRETVDVTVLLSVGTWSRVSLCCLLHRCHASRARERGLDRPQDALDATIPWAHCARISVRGAPQVFPELNCWVPHTR